MANLLNDKHMGIGDSFVEPLKFNYQEMETFLDIIKDHNPFHRLAKEDVNDPEKREKVIVQGMFAVCMFSGFTSRHFPESINVSREATFVRPLLIDDDYTMLMKIKNISMEDSVAEIKGYIKNSKGQVCIDLSTKLKNERLFGDFSVK